MEEGFVEVGARLSAKGLGEEARAKLAELEAKLPPVEVSLAAELAKGFAARARELAESAVRRVRPTIELHPVIAKTFAAQAQAEAQRALRETHPTLSLGVDIDQRQVEREIATAQKAAKASRPTIEVVADVNADQLSVATSRAIAKAGRKGALPTINVVAEVDMFTLRDSAVAAVAFAQAEISRTPLNVGFDLDPSKLTTGATEAVTAAQEAIRAQPLDVAFDIDPTVLIAEAVAAVKAAESAVPTMNIRTTGIGGLTNPVAAGASGESLAMGLTAAKGVAGVGVATAVVGAGLVKLGLDFDSAFDHIRIETGATGERLHGLEDTFRSVSQNSASSLDDVAIAVAGINQRTGATGPLLGQLASQFTDLSRVTGTDLTSNLKSGLDALTNFQVPLEQYPAMIDEVFRASQASGVSVSDLTSQLAESGAALRTVGFDFSTSTALIASLTKEGVPAASVLSSLTLAARSFAKAGKEPAEGLRETITAIKDAKTNTEALQLAQTVFGRQSAKIVDAIRGGRFEFQDFANSIGNGTETIQKAAAATDDFPEKLKVLRNRISALLEPIATPLFSSISDAVGELTDDVTAQGPAIASAVGKIGPIISASLNLLIALLPVVIPLFSTMASVLGVAASAAELLAPYLSDIVVAFLAFKTISFVSGIVTAAADSMQYLVQSISDLAATKGISFFAALRGVIGESAQEGLQGAVSGLSFVTIAATTAITAGFIIYQRWAEHVAKVKAQTDSLSQALIDQQDLSTQQVLGRQLKDSLTGAASSVDVLTKAGLSVSAVTKAVAGAPGEIDKFKGSVDGVTGPLENLESLTGRLNQGNLPFLGAGPAQGLKDLREAAKSVPGPVRTVVTSLLDAYAAGRINAKELQSAVQGLTDYDNAVRGSVDSLKLQAQRFVEEAHGVKLSADAHKQLDIVMDQNASIDARRTALTALTKAYPKVATAALITSDTIVTGSDAAGDATAALAEQVTGLADTWTTTMDAITGADQLTGPTGLTSRIGGVSTAIVAIINQGGDLTTGLTDIATQLGLTGDEAAAFLQNGVSFAQAYIDQVSQTRDAFLGLVPTVGSVFDELKSKADGVTPSFDRILDTLQKRLDDASKMAENIATIVRRGGTGVLSIIQQLPADEQATFIAQIASAGNDAFLKFEAQARAVLDEQTRVQGALGVDAIATVNASVTATSDQAVAAVTAQGVANLTILKATADQLRTSLAVQANLQPQTPGVRKLLLEDKNTISAATFGGGDQAAAVTSQVSGVTDAINASLATVPAAATKATSSATAALAPLPAQVSSATLPGLQSWSGDVSGVTDAVVGSFNSMAIRSIAAIEAFAQGVGGPLDTAAGAVLGFGLRIEQTAVGPVLIWVDQITGLVSARFTAAGKQWTTILGEGGLQAVGTWQLVLDEMVVVTETTGDRVADALIGSILAATPALVAAVQNYAKSLAGALNPVLAAVGAPTVTLGFARGGWVPGRDTGGDSVHAMLRPGEVVINVDDVQRWGPRNLLDLNAGRVPTGWQIPGYRDGGVVDPAGVTRGRAMADSAVGDPYVWGAVGPNGYDCSGLWSAIISAVHDQTPRRLFTSSSLIDQADTLGLLPGLGQISVASFKGNPGHVAGTIAGVNYEATPPRVRKGAGARGADHPLFTNRYHLGSGLFLPNGQSINLPAVPTIDDVGELSRTATAIMAQARAAAQTFVSANTYTASATLGDLIEAGTGQATGSNVTGWLTEAIALTGVGMDWLPYLLTGVQRESGGNPRAINLDDSNARRGTPSKGLLQVIDPTFARWHLPGHDDIFNPVDNTAAAIRYIIARYGDIRNVDQFNASKRPKGYALGGLVTMEDMDRMRTALGGIHLAPNPDGSAGRAGDTDRIVAAIDRLENLGPTVKVQTSAGTTDGQATSIAHRIAPLLGK